MSYDREPRYLHPFLLHRLENILDSITAKLPSGYRCKFISGYRSPADQFLLFQKGRTFRNGKWEVMNRSAVVTFKDGFTSPSRHNYLPSTAIDIGLFNSQNQYVKDPALYQHVGEGKQFGLSWGGDWHRFRDMPHLEIPVTVFFQKDIKKDNGLLWQRYLQVAGTYSGVLDGIFGPLSLAALKRATGEKERNRKAWDMLFSQYTLEHTVIPH